MQQFDGKISLKLKNKYLSFVEITKKDLRAMDKDREAARKLIKKARIYYPPPKNHPWRKFEYSRRRLVHA